MPAEPSLMERLTALCKRRGFIFPGSEIYGGLGGFWDYGPLGVELKRHIKDLWWRDMVLNPPPGPDGKELAMLGIDAALIMNPKVWEASGHVGGFADLMVECKECKARLRADQIVVHDFLVAGKLWTTFSIEVDTGGDAFQSAFLREFAEGHSDNPERARIVRSLRKDADRFLTTNKELAEKISEITGGKAKPKDVRAYLAKRAEVRIRGVLDSIGRINDVSCPRCGTVGALTEPREFNLMFETYTGAVRDEASKCYLRPETAQGIFVNYKNVLDTSRVKIPFGIAQIGKAFRNEINPRNYTFRSREFEQMEIEFFCRGTEARRHAGTKGEPSDMEWYAFWCKVRYDWYVNLGLKSEKLRLREQTEDELAHYSKVCADIEYLFPFSNEFQELEGVAHRGNYDLTQHQQHSGRDLTYFDDDLWQQDAHKYAGDKDAAKKAKQGLPYRYLPTVIEPSAGVDRAALAFLCEAYAEDEAPNDKGRMEKRVVMRLHPKLAPIKAAFFPLVNKAGMPEIAESLYRDAKKHMYAFFDAKGAIGRRYRRQDEAGTPFCITVDGETIEGDGTVTIRDRDTLAQVRVHKDQVIPWLRDHLV